MQKGSNDHYVQVSSKTRSVFFKNNCNYFKVKLQCPLDLTNGSWVVALTKIIYPHTWLNIKEDDARLFILHPGDKVSQVPPNFKEDIEYKTLKYINDYLNWELRTGQHYRVTDVKLENGYYENAGDLAADILQNFLLKRNVKDYEHLPFTYIYEKTTKRIRFFNAKALVFQNAGKFINGLGLVNKLYSWDRGTIFKCDGDLTAIGKSNVEKTDAIYAYSSVVEFNNVGEKSVPLLTVIPVEGKYGESIVYAPLKPEYKQVAQNYISDIEIQLNRNNGDLIDFEDGQEVTVTLHFKKTP